MKKLIEKKNLKDAFKRFCNSFQIKNNCQISLLQRNMMIIDKKCRMEADKGNYLKAHEYQQQALTISLAMCSIVSAAATKVAIDSQIIASHAVKVAIKLRKSVLELELNKIITDSYANNIVECDFAKCAKLQENIRSLSASIVEITQEQ